MDNETFLCENKPQSVVIQKSKKKRYIFDEDSISIERRHKPTRKITYPEIKKIVYTPKILFKEVFTLVFIILFCRPIASLPLHTQVRSFIICLKGKDEKLVRLWLTNKQFNLIKNTVKVPLIVKDFSNYKDVHLNSSDY